MATERGEDAPRRREREKGRARTSGARNDRRRDGKGNTREIEGKGGNEKPPEGEEY
jgi:hypothetical protein